VDTPKLISDLRHGDDPDLQRRRAIISVSLLGLASMACSMLFQTGIVKHLPDPPLKGFDSDKVNASHDSYRLGLPDGPLAVLAFAANLPLAAAAGADRASKHPWLPLLVAAKALAHAATALWYFSLMPRQERRVRRLHHSHGGRRGGARPQPARSPKSGAPSARAVVDGQDQVPVRSPHVGCRSPRRHQS
jgi:hypothetical protein